MKRLLFLLLSVVFLCTIALASAAPSPQAQSESQAARVVTKVNPKDGLTYVWIPPGKFMMGCSPDDQACDDDEKPAREVIIAKGFWIGQTLVTQAAFKRVTGENPSFFHGNDELPVDKADFGDAHEYCATVGMRLPNESEWEYAARANNPAARYGEPDAIAWYKDNSHERSHEVAQKQPNAWQLYDMLGDLWEWTTDPYKDESDYRVLRGGSWRTSGAGMRVSFRGLDDPERHRNFTGFRCVGEEASAENVVR
jgi:formylglycine-generating enzyme required for sulfatase activity